MRANVRELARRLSGTLLLLFLGAYVADVVAADIPIDLSITQTTVYRNGAMVTRSGEVRVPQGAQRLVLRGLPADLDGNALRVTVGNAAVALGSVEVGTINQTEFVSDRERDLRNQLEQKTDRRVAVQDEIATAETQLKLLESVAANSGGANNVNGVNLSAVLNTIGSSASAARNKIRDAKSRQRSLDREIEALQAELAKVATNKRRSSEVRVFVNAGAAAQTPVSISYRVNTAGWSWVYQARLDTAKKRLNLERQAQVRQGTGEDWNNVELTLTTAQPQGDVSTPVVAAQFLDLQVPQPVRALAAAPAQFKANQALAEDAVASAPRNAIETATQYLVEYQVPGRVNLAADREPRLFPVAQDAFDSELVARVVPSQNQGAYLEATFHYNRDVPIEAGELQLYRDGALVGTAATQAFLPGAEVRMPFGVDERIRVAVRDEAAQSAERGVLSKQVVKETKQRFEITSYHAAAIAVEVIDRVPVSKNADVKVEVLKGATEPSVKDLNGKTGVYLWKFSAEPQKTVAIRHYYSVRYPRDRELQTTEEY